MLKPGPYPIDVGVGEGAGRGGGGGGGTASSIYFLLGDPHFVQRRNFSELSGKTVNSKLRRVLFECTNLVQWRVVCYSSQPCLLPGEVRWGMGGGGGNGGHILVFFR